MSKYTSELEVAQGLVVAALAKGYFITVRVDNEETVITRCGQPEAIIDALNSSGVDGLKFYTTGVPHTGKYLGLMLLVWGNDALGRELIAGYSDNPTMNELYEEINEGLEP